MTVRPSRLRLWNVPITFELLTFPRSSVQCPQSPSVQRHLELLLSPSLAPPSGAMAALLLPPSLLMDGVETASVAIVTSFRSPSRKGGERGRLLIGRPLQSGFAVPPLSLFGAGDDLGRSVLKWQMRDDHIAATAAEQCQNRDGCRVSPIGQGLVVSL